VTRTPSFVLGLLFLPATASAQVASSSSTARPAFEVASVKLNSACGNQRGPNIRPSPGRLSLSCVSLRRLISTAYGAFADGVIRWVRPEVLGGPAWVDSDLYDIEAKTGNPATFEQINGVMLQALLEERFKVEVRREFREMPAYLLTVAKSGAKLRAAKGANCVPEDPYGGPPRFGRSEPFLCGRVRETSNNEGKVVEGYDVSMSDIVNQILVRYVDRPIIDRTGLTGKFDVHLTMLPTIMPKGPVRLNGVDVGSLPPPSDDDPLVFSFVEQQLGLKLSSGKGPVEFLIIANAERPSAN